MKKPNNNIKTPEKAANIENTITLTSAIQQSKGDKKVLVYIDKRTMASYSLRQITIENGEIIEDKEIHRDIPSIVYGKLLGYYKSLGFSGNG